MADKEAPKVSILMNCYNGEKYLKEAIDSVYAQTYDNWEIVFINNQSTDQSRSIAESYGEKVKIIDTPKFMTLGEGRNFGVGYCDGDFLCFLDVDDYFRPEKLKLQVEKMLEHPEAALCYTGFIRVDGQGKEINRVSYKAFVGNLFGTNLSEYEIGFLTVMIRMSELYKVSKPYLDPRLKFAPDYHLFLRLMVQADAIRIPEILGVARILEGSLTSKTIHVRANEIQLANEEVSKHENYLARSTPKQRFMSKAKVAYYRAYDAICEGCKKMAIKELSPYKFVNFRYFVLYVSSYSTFMWNAIHRLSGK